MFFYLSVSGKGCSVEIRKESNMDGRETIRERGRALEEEWVQSQMQQAVARLRATRREDEERRRLAEATQIRSPQLIARLRGFGFDAESASLLFLAPLVGMAVADGAVSYDERALIKEMARRGDIRPGSRAWAALDGWLLEPPSGEWLVGMLALLRDVLSELPAEEANTLRRRIGAALARVGRASGGFLGIGALSRAERRFLAECGDAGVSGEGLRP
jgi:tellurite resistance protein